MGRFAMVQFVKPLVFILVHVVLIVSSVADDREGRRLLQEAVSEYDMARVELEGVDTITHIHIESKAYGKVVVPVEQGKLGVLPDVLEVVVYHENGTSYHHAFNVSKVVEGKAILPTSFGNGDQNPVEMHHHFHGYFTKTNELVGTLRLSDPSNINQAHLQKTFHIEPSSMYDDDELTRAQDIQNTHVIYDAAYLREPEVRDGSVKLRKANAGPSSSWCPSDDDYNNMVEKHRAEMQKQPIFPRRRSVSSGDGATACTGDCTCPISLVADVKLYQALDNDNDEVTAYMVSHLNDVDSIYRATTFGDEFGIGVSVAQVVIYTSGESPSPVTTASYTAQNFLKAFSSSAWAHVCLVHVFTHREFSDGLLGLAWVGEKGAGICSSGYNSGFSTSLNYGATISRGISTQVMAHEVGHNFGSPHDSGNCLPGQSSSGGNYIMAPSATDGTKPNNVRFSSCSTDSISSVIQSQGGCFDSSRSYCGNGIVEGGEICDCGDHCDDPGICCTANCTLPTWAECSPQDPIRYPCCTSECKFVKAATLTVCNNQTDCLSLSVCNGNEASCPTQEPRDNGTLCGCSEDDCDTFPFTASAVCWNGQCRGSICAHYNASQCTLSAADCVVECMGPGWGNGSECISTADPVRRHPAVKNVLIHRPNTPCDDYNGYCDQRGVCNSVREQDVLNELEDFFKNLSAAKIWDWIKSNAQWVGVGIAVVIVLGLLLHFTRPKREVRKIGASSSSNQKKKRGQVHYVRNRAYTDYDSDDEFSTIYEGDHEDDDEEGESTALLSKHHGPSSASTFDSNSHGIGFFHKNITEHQAVKVLNRIKTSGAFLVRRDPRGKLVLSIWNPPVLHKAIYEDPVTHEYYLPTSVHKFSSLKDLAKHYSTTDVEDILPRPLTNPILYGIPPPGTKILLKP